VAVSSNLDGNVKLERVLPPLDPERTEALLGIAMGLAIAKGVAAYAGWTTIVTFSSIALSVGVSASVGLGFGIYPRSQLRPRGVLGCGALSGSVEGKWPCRWMEEGARPGKEEDIDEG
jgi:hypothetical protein